MAYRDLTAEEASDLYLGIEHPRYDRVWVGNADQRRWYVNYDVCVRDRASGELFLFTYSVAATECQENQDWPATLTPAESYTELAYRAKREAR